MNKSAWSRLLKRKEAWSRRIHKLSAMIQQLAHAAHRDRALSRIDPDAIWGQVIFPLDELLNLLPERQCPLCASEIETKTDCLCRGSGWLSVREIPALAKQIYGYRYAEPDLPVPISQLGPFASLCGEAAADQRSACGDSAHYRAQPPDIARGPGGPGPDAGDDVWGDERLCDDAGELDAGRDGGGGGASAGGETDPGSIQTSGGAAAATHHANGASG